MSDNNFINVIILTGCGCSGKTTIYNKLQKTLNRYNFYFNGETATSVIERRYKSGRLVPWEFKGNNRKDIWNGFEEEIYNSQVNQTKHILNHLDCNIVLDRSFEDVIAYTQMALNAAPTWKIDNTKKFINTEVCNKWDRDIELKFNVFIYKPIDFIHDNSIRNFTLDAHERKVEYDYIVKTYMENFDAEELHIEEKVRPIEERFKEIVSYLM